MNPHQLKRLFPRASAATLAANAGDYGTQTHDNNPRPQIPNPEPQRHEAKPLGEAIPGEAKGDDRVVVRFTGYRVRPLDPDNFAGSTKDLLDGLRHARLILGDEPWRIRLETEQVRVGTFAEEKTVIQIISQK